MEICRTRRKLPDVSHNLVILVKTFSAEYFGIHTALMLAFLGFILTTASRFTGFFDGITGSLVDVVIIIYPFIIVTIKTNGCPAVIIAFGIVLICFRIRFTLLTRCNM